MDFARNQNPQWRLQFLHGANLDGRSVSAEQQPFTRRLRFLIGEEQRVLSVARRMVWRKIQRLEVVVVGLDDRTFSNRVAKIAKDGDDFVHGADDGVLLADWALDAGEGDVD